MTPLIRSSRAPLLFGFGAISRRDAAAKQRPRFTPAGPRIAMLMVAVIVVGGHPAAAAEPISTVAAPLSTAVDRAHAVAQEIANDAGDARVLDIHEQKILISGQPSVATTVNGSVPGPLIRLQEGREVTLLATNHLKEDTSIHWHGLILPPGMDGVPGVSFAGIKPGATFTYRFPVVQSGTYWYHSHSEFQEQVGLYGPIIIDPVGRDPVQYDRDYVVMLSDWTFENPHRVLQKLKQQAGYYNFQRRTAVDLFADASAMGWRTTIADRMPWSRMRMDPTDIADVTGTTYTYLLNGLPPQSAWSGLFKPHERIRLRFINAGAGTYFDVRIPGLAMTVVQADGQNVQPVTVDEFRIAIAETYDVIVQPMEDQAFTIFAETMDRSGFAAGTLAPRPGMTAPIPARRKRPVLTMADMGMGSMPAMKGMDGGTAAPAGDMGNMKMPAPKPAESAHAPADPAMGAMPGMAAMAPGQAATVPDVAPVKHGKDTHGSANSVVPMETKTRLAEAGIGLDDAPWRVLVYQDLRSLTPSKDLRPPGREIELHLTGNMERYMWGFDGKKFSEAKPVMLHHGERVRLTLVNDTMMNHPIHLHGMFMDLDNGNGAFNPLKHTINVKPAERISLNITADALGNWAMHCHILYHMEMGMFRIVSISDQP